MNLPVPSDDRVLVRVYAPKETQLASKLWIPSTAQEEPMSGDVVAVGPGCLNNDGNRIPMDFVIGEKVFFAKYSGEDVELLPEMIEEQAELASTEDLKVLPEDLRFKIFRQKELLAGIVASSEVKVSG